MSVEGDKRDEIEALHNENKFLMEKLEANQAALAGMVCKDPVVERNRQMLLERSNVGIQKYGVMLNRPDLSPQDWVQHLLEELLDAANYAQAFLHNQEPANRIMQYRPRGSTAWEDAVPGFVPRPDLYEIRYVEVVK